MHEIKRQVAMEWLAHKMDGMSVGDHECALISLNINLDLDLTKAACSIYPDENTSCPFLLAVLPLTIQHEIPAAEQDDIPWSEFLEDEYLEGNEEHKEQECDIPVKEDSSRWAELTEDAYLADNEGKKEPEHDIGYSADLPFTPRDDKISCSAVEEQSFREEL